MAQDPTREQKEVSAVRHDQRVRELPVKRVPIELLYPEQGSICSQQTPQARRLPLGFLVHKTMERPDQMSTPWTYLLVLGVPGTWCSRLVLLCFFR